MKAPGRHPIRRTARALALAGKWHAYLPLAVGVTAYLLSRPGRPVRSRRVGAGAIVLASATAAALGPVFDRVLQQPPAPPGHRSRRKPVFPSGHALGSTALGLTSAYVLARERLMPTAAAVSVALAYPLLSSGGKLVDDKHWASDLVGGSLAGAAIAAACLAAYEGQR